MRLKELLAEYGMEELCLYSILNELFPQFSIDDKRYDIILSDHLLEVEALRYKIIQGQSGPVNIKDKSKKFQESVDSIISKLNQSLSDQFKAFNSELLPNKGIKSKPSRTAPLNREKGRNLLIMRENKDWYNDDLVDENKKLNKKIKLLEEQISKMKAKVENARSELEEIKESSSSTKLKKGEPFCKRDENQKQERCQCDNYDNLLKSCAEFKEKITEFYFELELKIEKKEKKLTKIKENLDEQIENHNKSVRSQLKNQKGLIALLKQYLSTLKGKDRGKHLELRKEITEGVESLSKEVEDDMSQIIQSFLKHLQLKREVEDTFIKKELGKKQIQVKRSRELPMNNEENTLFYSKYCLLSIVNECINDKQKSLSKLYQTNIEKLNEPKKTSYKSIYYKACNIEIIKQESIDKEETSAIVIPFNEQLRTNYLSTEYEKLAEKAGEHLEKACKLYKNQHFRLRTGLATVFPAGNLNFHNIIAAVGPISSDNSMDELLKKTMLSILDIMIDYDFKSILVPSFSSEVSKIPEDGYIQIVLETLMEYIAENEEEIKGRRIGFKEVKPDGLESYITNTFEEYQEINYEAFDKNIGEASSRNPKMVIKNSNNEFKKEPLDNQHKSPKNNHFNMEEEKILIEIDKLSSLEGTPPIIKKKEREENDEVPKHISEQIRKDIKKKYKEKISKLKSEKQKLSEDNVKQQELLKDHTSRIQELESQLNLNPQNIKPPKREPKAVRKPKSKQ